MRVFILRDGFRICFTLATVCLFGIDKILQKILKKCLCVYDIKQHVQERRAERVMVGNAGEECRGYDSRQHVQERSTEHMMVGKVQERNANHMILK